MKTHTQFLCPLLALLVACSNGGSADTASPLRNYNDVADATEHRQLPSDAQILAMIYDNSYSAPADFFVDERSSTTRSYTVHHVMDASQSYELCTDDFDVARGWEDADNSSRIVSGQYVAYYENERYFEFVRELSYDSDIGNIDELTSPGFARVFKCSNTNRDGVDRSRLNGYAGTLSSYPLTDHTVRVFTEYLWQFTFFPHSRKLVVDSYTANSGETLQHTLLLAFAINQGTNRCDRIEIATWDFSADRVTGEITRHYNVVRGFEAIFENGTASRCD